MGIELLRDDEIYNDLAYFAEVSHAAVAGPDGIMTAASACYDEDYWTTLYTEGDYEVDTGGSKITISEGKMLVDAFNKKLAPHGIYLGGNNYKLVKYTSVPSRMDRNFPALVLANNGRGAFVVKFGDGNLLITLWNEELEQSSGNALIATMHFADTLIDLYGFEEPRQ